MSGTWPRAQIRAREAERPWQQRAVFSACPPLLLVPLSTAPPPPPPAFSSLVNFLLLPAAVAEIKINLNSRMETEDSFLGCVELVGQPSVCFGLCCSRDRVGACDSSCGGQMDSTGVTTASHIRPTESMQQWGMAALYTQHHSANPGEDAECVKHTPGRNHNVCVSLCTEVCMYFSSTCVHTSGCQ